MATITITTFFTENGSPKTGLSATIRIRNVSSTALVITDEAMTEVGDGFYKYSFTSYDNTIDYVIRAEGGATLSDTDRYVFSSSEQAKQTIDGDNIFKIESGDWQITGNQWIHFDTDGTTELFKFNLFDNFGKANSSNVFKRERV